MLTIAVDFETYYDKECSVSTLGPRGYFSHPNFDAYMVSVVADDGYEWCGPPKEFNWNMLAGNFVLSHNASFDESLYLYGCEQGWWPTAAYSAWHCTADLAAYCKLPRNLKGAVAALYDVDISKGTRDAMKNLQWDAMDPDFKEEVIKYALDDSRWCLKIWKSLADKWPLTERYFSEHTRTICRRGLPVNEELIESNAAKLRVLLWEAEQAIPWRDTGALLSRNEANKLCRATGITPPASWAMGDATTEAWLDTYSEQFPWVWAVRSYRRVNALLKKIEAFERGTVDGRYYGGLLYYGAHTGRFSGSGGNLNLQNLPRGDTFGVNLRSQIQAGPENTLVIVDLSQIEVRTLCWLAGDFDTLAEIAASDDMYEVFAIRFGLWSKDRGSLKANDSALRSLVKGIVLGCGYGASTKKFSQIMDCSLEEAEKNVSIYRKSLSKVVELWKHYERNVKMACKSKEYNVPLPSGNTMQYKNLVRAADAVTCTVIRNGKPMIVRPWYGMITENCSQSLARDIFCHQLKQIEDAGYKIILHVHDEVVIEVRADLAEAALAEVIQIMSTAPDWIPNIPLSSEGKISTDYTK